MFSFCRSMLASRAYHNAIIIIVNHMQSCSVHCSRNHRPSAAVRHTCSRPHTHTHTHSNILQKCVSNRQSFIKNKHIDIVSASNSAEAMAHTNVCALDEKGILISLQSNSEKNRISYIRPKTIHQANVVYFKIKKLCANLAKVLSFR